MPLLLHWQIEKIKKKYHHLYFLLYYMYKHHTSKHTSEDKSVCTSKYTWGFSSQQRHWFFSNSHISTQLSRLSLAPECHPWVLSGTNRCLLLPLRSPPHSISKGQLPEGLHLLWGLAKETKQHTINIVPPQVSEARKQFDTKGTDKRI